VKYARLMYDIADFVAEERASFLGKSNGFLRGWVE
jgi:hypothetical protein